MPSDNEATTAKSNTPPRGEDAPTSPSPVDSRSEEGEARSDDGKEPSTQQEKDTDHSLSTQPPGDQSIDEPPLPDEPLPGASTLSTAADRDAAPPLPSEAPPSNEPNDGWSAQWDATNQRWYFYNEHTGVSQWDNPRVPTADAAAAQPAAASSISQPTSVAGGYNPAIHGDWDPTAPYAQAYKAADEDTYEADLAAYNAEMDAEEAGEGAYGQNAAFNSRTGRFQTADQTVERHSDASKSYRQMNAYFNVDQAANSHDGRSLKAERRGKQPTRKELAMWKEKRKARKEEKRRAWLRD